MGRPSYYRTVNKRSQHVISGRLALKDITSKQSFTDQWDTLVRYDKELDSFFCRECGFNHPSTSRIRDHAATHL